MTGFTFIIGGDCVMGSILKLIRPQCSKNAWTLKIPQTSPAKFLLLAVAVKYVRGDYLYNIII